MKALTVLQPHASLLALCEKRIETRSWPTQYRGLIAIHAGKRFPLAAQKLCLADPIAVALVRRGALRLRDSTGALTDWPDPLSLPLGAIVAVANLHRVGEIGRRPDGAVVVSGQDLPITGDELAFGDFTPGRYGWVVTNVRRLPEPVECRGAQGLWDVPGKIVEQIRAQGIAA